MSTAKPKVCAEAKPKACAGLLGRPATPLLRPGEVLIWQGQPCWRGLAASAFHVREVGLWVCVLVFVNAVAARRALISAVAVSDGCPGDVAIRLKPGQAVGFAKLWPYARPWRMRRPEPMLRALADAGRAGALLSRTVAEAQAAAMPAPVPAEVPAPGRVLEEVVAS